jgi:hypothetical protein
MKRTISDLELPEKQIVNLYVEFWLDVIFERNKKYENRLSLHQNQHKRTE